MAELATLWIGDRLGPIEAASLRSFLRQGDRITVYAYHDLAVPDGVHLADAGTILSGARILRDRRTGSPAIHADLFRYRMIAQTGKIWVDLDIIALKPFAQLPMPWIFGRETATSINNAVLHLPPDSRTLGKLLAYGPDTVAMPPALRGLRRLKYWLRSLGRGLPLDRWPWGGIGPRALTHFLEETGESTQALPVEAFYAIPQSDAARFLEPGAITPEGLPAEAWGVHLWAKDLRSVLDARYGGHVPEGSFLDLVLRDVIR